LLIRPCRLGGGLLTGIGLLITSGLRARRGLLIGSRLLAGSRLLIASGLWARRGLLIGSRLLAGSGLLIGSRLLTRNGLLIHSLIAGGRWNRGWRGTNGRTRECSGRWRSGRFHG
jgi:hypothetical protein